MAKLKTGKCYCFERNPAVVKVKGPSLKTLLLSIFNYVSSSNFVSQNDLFPLLKNFRNDLPTLRPLLNRRKTRQIAASTPRKLDAIQGHRGPAVQLYIGQLFQRYCRWYFSNSGAGIFGERKT